MDKPSQPRKIAFANQKGGVGKTTTCINLAASLSAMKRRVLLVDLDPQGNATLGSGVRPGELKQTVNDLLLGRLAAEEVRIQRADGYDLIPASPDLTEAEIKLLQVSDREFKLNSTLGSIVSDYDFIFFDCPPSLNMLTVNALVAADSILIPLQCEYFGLEGLSALINIMQSLKKTANPGLYLEGIVRTMYDPRNCLTKEVSEQLSEHFGEQLYQTTIPRNVRLAEAPSYGISALEYDKRSAGALAYLALAGELLRRQTAKSNDEHLAEMA